MSFWLIKMASLMGLSPNLANQPLEEEVHGDIVL
jgi:hypothetical protein